MILLVRFALIGAVLALWIYCALDVIRTDAERVPYVPKLVWLALVILVVPVGPIAWLVLGKPDPLRPRGAGAHPTVVPPDDSPEFLRKLGDEIKRRRRTEELRRRDFDRDRMDEEIRRLEDEFRDPDEGQTG